MSGNRLRLAVLAGLVASVSLTVTLYGQTPDARLVQALVLRNGQPVSGLTRADFVVRESGAIQQFDLVSPDTVPLNVLLVLDTSASVRGPVLDQLKAGLRAVVAGLRPSDQLAVMSFSYSVNLRAPWGADSTELTGAIDSLAGQGGTALTDAGFAALTLRARPGSRTLILVFSDGDDTVSWLSTTSVLDVARRAHAVISSVMLNAGANIGANVAGIVDASAKATPANRAQVAQWLAEEPLLYRPALLPLLASETGGETIVTTEAVKLATAFTEMVSRHRQRYLLRYTPAATATPGWHPLQVEIKGGGDVIARAGYLR